jgi:hypothetical protein
VDTTGTEETKWRVPHAAKKRAKLSGELADMTVEVKPEEKKPVDKSDLAQEITE